MFGLGYWFWVWVAIFGTIVAMIANSKGAKPLPWFIYGAAIFPIALTHILLKKREDFEEWQPSAVQPLGSAYRSGPPRPPLPSGEADRLIKLHGPAIGYRACALINEAAARGEELSIMTAVAMATNENARANAARR